MGSLTAYVFSTKNILCGDIRSLRERRGKLLKEKVPPLLLYLLLSLMTTTTILVNQVNSQTTTTMAVEPETIIDPSLTPSTTFQINVTVNLSLIHI